MRRMKGTNPIRPPVADDGQSLAVKSIFATVQGEGPYAGQAAIFIRLGGCNLACAFCDTAFEDFAAMEKEAIVREVKRLAAGQKLVVITGGEPLRQNIAPLCEDLLAHGFRIQVETNGTLYRELPADVHIVCSPKNTNGGYYPVRGDLLARVDAFKFLISASDAAYRDVPEIGQGSIPVFVQPMDEADEGKNAANLARAAKIAQLHGYRLSLQLHKILGIE